jgi:hypothetical protein
MPPPHDEEENGCFVKVVAAVVRKDEFFHCVCNKPSRIKLFPVEREDILGGR